MIQKFTIGRDQTNNIVVQDPTVSGYHADLIVDDSSDYTQYTFVDHSTNGTIINGQFLRNASCYVVYNDSILLAGKVPFDWNSINYILSNSPGSNYAVNPSLAKARQTKDITFGGALRSFFNNYVNFSGRATRKEYWFAYLWLLIFQTGLYLLALPFVFSAIGWAMDDLEYFFPALFGMGWYVAVWFLYSLIVFLPSLSLLVRRIHDTGKDGLWILMLLVPFANIVFFFIWTLTPSENKPNKWGR